MRPARQSAAAFSEEDAGEPEVGLTPILELVAKHHGVRDTVRRAEEHVERAVAAIAPFPSGAAKDALLEAARFAVARDR